jgi:hypothetical protein
VFGRTLLKELYVLFKPIANVQCIILDNLVNGLESSGEGNIPEPQNVPGHTA